MAHFEPRFFGKGDFLSDAILAREEEVRLKSAQRESDKVRRMEVYLQKTALFRAHLLGLAAVAEETLAHFQVDEVLESARKYYPNFKIETVAPPYYENIVNPTAPHERFSINGRTIGIDGLENSADFQTMAPSLMGYGRILEKVEVGSSSRIIGSKTVVESTGSGGGSWSGSGDSGALRYPATGGPTFRTELILEEDPVRMRDVTTMAVKTYALRQEGIPSYDLRYTYNSTRTVLTRYPLPPRGTVLAPGVHIPFSDAPDTFKNMIAGQIARERQRV